MPKNKQNKQIKMADEDEIDILGDFSFNSCLAKNNRGIPSCSDEDTVHPQWLLDSTANNWYDIQNKDGTTMRRFVKEGQSRMLPVKNRVPNNGNKSITWTVQERQMLVKEMSKYGRDIRKISQKIKSKTEAEIQTLIDAEFGVNLETPYFGVIKSQEETEDVPAVVQEEVVTDDDTINEVINMVTTASPTIKLQKIKTIKSLLKPEVLLDIKKTGDIINQSEIFYEDELILGSTESVGADFDAVDIVTKSLVKSQKIDTKSKLKVAKKIGNHRRKHSTNDKADLKPRNKSKDKLKSPQRQRKDSSLSEESVKSPKLQLVFSSGQALPVSEGEQVIKIEKKKDSDPESDIDIDVDSSSGDEKPKKTEPPKITKLAREEAPVAVPLRKFEPMPRRQKRINLDGEGGYTIMHTEKGDLYAVGSEPRRERSQRKQPVHLIQCTLYGKDRPAPYSVRLHVSALLLMDTHAHTSRGEVMGLLGGAAGGGDVTVMAYRPARAAASTTHCDMDPVSQAQASESLHTSGHTVLGWHHSHPTFPPTPSLLDLQTQLALQRALERPSVPFLGVITSQHWATGRTASQYRCIRVEETPEAEVGYQFSVKLCPDMTSESLPAILAEMAEIRSEMRNELSVEMSRDVCPQAGVTYLEKCLSSIRHHMRSAEYADTDVLVEQLVQGVTDVFR